MPEAIPIHPPRPLPGTDELYRLLVQNVTDYAIFMLSPDGSVVSWNEGAERIHGYRDEEIVGRHMSVFYLPEDAREGKPERHLRDAVRHGRAMEEGWRIRKDGSRMWVSMVMTGLWDPDGRLVGVGKIVRDLTDRKQIALQYEESRQRYRSLFENNPDAVFSFDLEGSLVSANPACERMSGLAVEELVERALLSLVVDEERARVWKCFEQAVAGKPQHLETAILDRNGERVEVSVTLVPIVVNGERIGVYGIAEDVTERKRAEAEREVLLARERVARADAEAANQAKSDFLAVMSHELKTPLNVIDGYTAMLAEGLSGPLNEAQVKQLDRVQANSRHLLHLINEVLSYARMEAGREDVRLEAVDLAARIRDTVALLEPLARDKELRLHVEVPSEPWTVRTDAEKAGQILLHLLSNAIKFTERGEVTVEARPESGGALIRVRDTGVGIPPEYLKRIWEPFWQAEDPMTRRAEGTGLGLSVARRTARLLGGNVEVESTPGVGSTFSLRFPAASA